MSEKERLIDLDYSIARLLFSKHAFEPHPFNFALCASCNRNCRDEVHVWPRYSIDYAAAMLVLEAMRQKHVFRIKFGSDHVDFERMVGIYWDEPFRCNNDRGLPEQICLFAKQIFSK